MTAVFVKILNMSLTAGYCILAVMVLRFLLRKQAKILSYLLWSVVLFRLLCPFSLTSSYSLLRMNTAVVSQESLTGAGKTDGTVWQGKGYIFEEGEKNGGVTEVVSSISTMEAEKVDKTQRALTAGAWIWIAGIAVLIGYSLWTAFCFRRFLSQAVLAEEGVYEAEGIATPFVSGLIRPKIYMPPHLQSEERQYVLAHERVHIARRDYLIKLVAWGAVCLHWFNPLVWIAFTLMERDMEMSCDEAVLRKLGGDVKQAYSMALLQLSCGESSLFRSPTAFGEGSVKRRIRNILGWRRRGTVAMVTLAILLGSLVLGLALNPADAAQKEAEEQLRLGFVNAYANAFCDRDGNTLVGMYADETAAYESLPALEKAGGKYSFGFSSPWPNEFRFVLSEGETEEEDMAEIWYYAWTSDPHVTVWKEEIRFIREGYYLVTDSSFRYMDSISSKADFDAAYLIGGEYQFTDYVERGFLEAVNEQTIYDREEGSGVDRNAAYRDPVTAAEWVFNLSGGEGEKLYGTDMQAAMQYTFMDGSYVEIPMYNARYGAETEVFGEVDQEGGIAADVWLPDLEVWNAKAP